MPLDTFICGSCLLTFNDIDAFVTHKHGCTGSQRQEQNVGVPAAESQLSHGEPGTETMAAVSAIPPVDCKWHSFGYFSIGFEVIHRSR